MASFLDNLKAAREAAAETLARVLASPKPTYNVDGQSVSWTEYQAMLSKQIDALTAQINSAEPFEIIS